MTANADVVLKAMGWSYNESGKRWYAFGYGQWTEAIDANFIVGAVIPWAVERGFTIAVAIGSPDSGEPEQFDVMVRNESGEEFLEREPGFVAAHLAALAAALRAGER